MNENLAYQDSLWEELIDGQLVMMAPASSGHTFLSENILMIFKQYLKGKKCVPFGDGLLVHLTDRDKFVPDMMVVCDHSKIKPNHIEGAPDLVVEVLSPSTAKNDRTHKMAVYEQCGVREYWLVSPSDRFIEDYWLEDGKFVLHDVYSFCTPDELELLSPERRAAVVSEFKCRLFDDLTIRLEDIFDKPF